MDAEGEVEPADETPDALDAVLTPPPLRGLGAYDVLVESVPLAGGGWAHLVDSARRAGAEDDAAAVRDGASRRRGVPDANGRATTPVTVVAGGTVRLR